MRTRCIFIALASLLFSCAAPASEFENHRDSAPPQNRVQPWLPDSDQGLHPGWFLGRWRVGDSACQLYLDGDGTAFEVGPVRTVNCEAPWADVDAWRKAEGGSLFVLTGRGDTVIWRAGAIQPTAIAGVSGEGQPVRLYWDGEGSHGGWIQPRGEPQP